MRKNAAENSFINKCGCRFGREKRRTEIAALRVRSVRGVHCASSLRDFAVFLDHIKYAHSDEYACIAFALNIQSVCKFYFSILFGTKPKRHNHWEAVIGNEVRTAQKKSTEINGQEVVVVIRMWVSVECGHFEGQLFLSFFKIKM